MSEYKLVLVDDEPEVLRALEREVSDFADENDLEIFSFNSSVEALEWIKLNHESTALLISDQKMPEMKGCDLLSGVREINSDIIAILLTAHTDIDDIIKTIQADLYSFVLKPWNIDKLLFELKKGLETFQLKIDKKKYMAKLDEELRWGGELQRKLLQIDLPLQTKAIFSVAYEPVECYCCGGDYYDIVQIDENKFFALIGDVAGHGVKAAFITFMIKTLLGELPRQIAEDNPPTPATLLAWLNERLFDELVKIQTVLVTFSVALIDLEEKTLTVSSAGHVPVKIIEDDKITEIPVPGTALGFKRDLTFKEKTVPIKTNDRIIMMTDGISELHKGKKTADHILLSYDSSSEFTDHVIPELKSFAREIEKVDDMTLISIEIL